MRYLSLFSGMEAAHIAWALLGWTCAAVAEIDPNACALLGHRLNASQPKYLPVHIPVLVEETGEWSTDPFPRTAYAHLPPFGTSGTLPNLGDVSQSTAEDIASLGHIDVVIGGSPCQDLSVAGRRAGLAGARSGLFHEQLRIFHAARSLCGARWLVWENVPGAFSSNAGRDFAVVVGALAGCELDVPADGWGNEGVALGDHGLVEWAVLDSQWFGVAQRRRRVFAVLDTGDWASRSPVLLERDSLRGDSAPRRETGEGVAGTLSSRTQGGGGLGTDFECNVGLIPDVCPAITSKWAKGSGGPSGDECQNLIPEVAHTLRADGFDASEDGTGRGTPLIAEPYTLAIRGRGDESVLEYRQDGTANALLLPNGVRAGIGVGAIAFDCKASGMQVRRLTPRECERLQSADDDWTLVPNAKGKPMADGPRYKLLGNSFTATVIRWIGRQIERAISEGAMRLAA